MKRNVKRLWSALLVFALVVGLIPMTALAQEPDTYTVKMTGGVHYSTGESEFTVKEKSSFTIRADEDQIPAGKYIEKFTDEAHGFEVTDPHITMPGHDLNLTAVYADQEEWLIDLSAGTIKISASLGHECPFIDSTGRNPFVQPNGTQMDVNGDGTPDIEFVDRDDESGEVTLKSLNSGIEDATQRLPGYQYAFVYLFGITPNTYTVRFNGNGGSGSMADVTVQEGETLTLPDCGFTPQPGKEFVKWDAGEPGQQVEVTSDSTITAIWKDKSTTTPSNAFTDVSDDAWYKTAVDYVVERGVMQGTAADTFSPGVITTRAMIVTILYRLEGEPTVSGASPYEDVAEGQWYTNAIQWANTYSIVNGYGNGKFGPSDNITRQQFAAILYRYANFKKSDTSKTVDLSQYSDANTIGDWALAAMKWANAEGLITGRTETTLVPTGNATRAEAAAIFMRLMSKMS